MAGRRSHPRFVATEPWRGALQVLRDVIIQRTSRDELLALSHSPAARDEEMSLELISAGRTLALSVRVLESRPVIVDGSVRHRLRLVIVEGPDGAEPGARLAVVARGVPS